MPTLASIAPGALLMPERIDPCAFAERYRLLPSDQSLPGPYSTAVATWQRSPQQAAANPDVQEIGLLCASQIGKSLIMENILLAWCCSNPGVTVWCLPDENSRNKFVHTRLRSIINATPRWREELAHVQHPVTLELAKFHRMNLILAIATVESQLAQTSAPYIVVDEVDKMPPTTGREGHAYDQLRKRQRTFPGKRKALVSSTPTTSEGFIWKFHLTAQQLEWCIPCPECSQIAPWFWENVRWPARPPHISHQDHATQIQTDLTLPITYQCPHCAHHIPETHLREMDLAGTWAECDRPLTPTLTYHKRRLDLERTDTKPTWHPDPPLRPRISYHKPSIATLFTPVRDLVVRWLQAEEARHNGDDSKRRDFTLHELARPYAAKRIHVEESHIVERVLSHLPRGVVPRDTIILTRAIDVQLGSMYLITVAWRRDLSAHVVDHQHLQLSILQADDLTELDTILRTPYIIDGTNKTIIPPLTLIDSGHFTLDVYAFCSRYKGAVAPCKGSADSADERGITTTKTEQIYRISKDTKAPHRGKLVNIGSFHAREFVAARLQTPLGKPGHITFHADVATDPDFQRQIVSENRVYVPGNNNPIWKKRPGYNANHYWDALVYATAAAALRGLLKRHKKGPPT